jgi:FkbM family methyltransferase
MRCSRLRYYFMSIPPLLVGIQPWPLVLAAFLGLPLRRPFTITLRGSGLRFRVRSALDIWIIKETCIDRAYERASVQLQPGWTVVDIGAGVGDFALYVARLHAASHVYAFEPSPDSFGLFTENIALNDAANVHPLPYAVGGRRDDTLWLQTNTAAVQHRTAAAPIGGLAVPGKSLDQIMAELELRQCDFLKMDCEGAEYDILLHASAATLSHIRHICLEYHEGVTPYTRADLVQYLQTHGFAVQIYPNPVHATLGLLAAVRCPTSNEG